MTKKKKIIIAAVAVVLIAGGLKVALGSRQTEPTGTPVTTGTVVRQDLEEVLKQKATLEGTESAEVASKLHYEVKQVLVKEGDKVTKGQLLAVLDSGDIQDQIAQTKGDIQLLEYQQQETLAERQRQIDNALMEKENAEKDYKDQQDLFAIGAASQAEVDAAKDALDKAQRALDDIPNENGKAVLTSSEKQTKANAQQKASIQSATLSDCQIRSAISGTVTRVNTTVGRFADESEDNKPMFVIENLETLQMKVLVSENDIDRVQIGQEVEISADVLGKETVQGVVERISPTGEAKSSTSSERVIPVYIKVKEENEKLIAGINANATIKIASAKDALVVPLEALAELEDGTTAVYTVTDAGTVHIVPVTLGLETDLQAEIKSDEIKEGQKIILNPSAAMTEGMAVAVQQG